MCGKTKQIFKDETTATPKSTLISERDDDMKDDEDGIVADELQESVRNQQGDALVETREGSSLLRFSNHLPRQLKRQGSSVAEALPDTPTGWATLCSVLMSMGLGYEVSLQKSLTQPPLTMGQIPEGSLMASIHNKLTAEADSILSRPIHPSLFVGTRGLASSAAAFLHIGPSSSEEHLRFREIIDSPIDGASFSVDWEVPWKANKTTTERPVEARKQEILKGPIQEPVVIILHGINTDSSFGYIKSLQRSFTDRGWNAAAMNYRGCGGVALKTPRSYNASYTGDLRSLVWSLSNRVAEDVPVFLIGNSVGAGIMTNYLGQEGLCGTLPKCVAGAVSLGNPLHLTTDMIKFPFSVAVGLGIKKIMLENWSTFSKMTDRTSRSALRGCFLAPTVAAVEKHVIPLFAANDTMYPFSFRIGYENSEDHYKAASSFEEIQHIPVPFLNLIAADDFLAAKRTKGKLGFCISNPNVMLVETRCGGHLGWHESPPDSAFGASSWADVASADFFDAIMQANKERYGTPLGKHMSPGGNRNEISDDAEVIAARMKMHAEASRHVARLKSKL